MYLYFELLGLIESVIGEYLDDEEGDGDGFVLFCWEDGLYLSVVEVEFVWVDFVCFFSNFLDEGWDFILLEREVDVHGEEAHEGDHELLF